MLGAPTQLLHSFISTEKASTNTEDKLRTECQHFTTSQMDIILITVQKLPQRLE